MLPHPRYRLLQCHCSCCSRTYCCKAIQPPSWTRTRYRRKHRKFYNVARLFETNQHNLSIGQRQKMLLFLERPFSLDNRDAPWALAEILIPFVTQNFHMDNRRYVSPIHHMPHGQSFFQYKIPSAWTKQTILLERGRFTVLLSKDVEDTYSSNNL